MLSKTEAKLVYGGKRKPDIDSTGTSKVTPWEEHVDAMDVGTSYRQENFVVRVFISKIPGNAKKQWCDHCDQ